MTLYAGRESRAATAARRASMGPAGGLLEHVGEDGRFPAHRLRFIRTELRALLPPRAFAEANRLVTTTIARGGQAWPVVRLLLEAAGERQENDEDESAPASDGPAAAGSADGHKKASASLALLIAGARAMLIGGLARELYRLLVAERQTAEGIVKAQLETRSTGGQQDAARATEGLASSAALDRLAQLLQPWYQRTAYGMSSLLYDQAGLTDHRLTDRAVRALLRAGAEDVTGIVQETRAKVQQVLSNAWLNNWTYARAVQALETSGAFSEARAQLIARTEVVRASNLAAKWVYKSSPSVDRVLITDGTGDEICAPYDGMVVDVGDLDSIPELGHPNCTRQFHPLTAVREAASPTELAAAGLIVKARDTGRVLLIQRSLSDEDDPAAGDWEFPGGHIEPGESALAAAVREWSEEVGVALPALGRVTVDWIQPNGIYQAFVYEVEHEADVGINADHEDRHLLNPDDPDGDGIEVAAWWDPADLPKMPALRLECRTTPWELLEAARAAPHRYAYVTLALPEDLAVRCRAFGAGIDSEDLAGDGLEDDPHVTVKYGLLEDDVETVRERLRNMVPMLTFGPTSVFAAGEKGGGLDVLKVDVFSQTLQAMHTALNCLPHEDSHAEYKPHVTLAYLKPGAGAKYAGQTVLGGAMMGSQVTYVHKDRTREAL